MQIGVSMWPGYTATHSLIRSALADGLMQILLVAVAAMAAAAVQLLLAGNHCDWSRDKINKQSDNRSLHE